MKKMAWKSLLAIPLLGLLAACNSGEGANGKDNEKVIELSIAGQFPESHPNIQNLNEFKKEVEEASQGNITVKIFPANQLGDYTQIYEELSRGNSNVDMGLISIPGQLDPKLELSYVHYLAENYGQAKEIFSSSSMIYGKMEEINAEQNVKFLGFHVEGFGGIGTTKEIDNPTEPGVEKGLLLRVPPIDVFTGNAKTLGFRTVSVPYADLYQALQTGVADGWSGGPPSSNYVEFKDVIKYYYQYNNFFENTSLVMNMDTWDELSEENQLVIEEAAGNLSDRSVDLAEKNDKEYMDKMREEGIEVIEFTEEELRTFAEYTRENNWPELEGQFGTEIMNDLFDLYK